MEEIYAGVTALVATGRASEIPWVEVEAGLRAMQGCKAFVKLYRPDPTTPECDLASSAEATELLSIAPGNKATS